MHKQITASTLRTQHHPVGTRGCDVIPRPRRKTDVSGENITRRSEPWQSEGLSEMVPRGTVMEGGGEVEVKRGSRLGLGASLT